MKRLFLADDGAALAMVHIIFMNSTDDELVAAWQRSGGEAGDPIADIIAFELERREVAF